MRIPESVWEAETHHQKIWRSAGNCTECGVKPRHIVCSYCQEPLCTVCASLHSKRVHKRERYIEALASKIDTAFPAVTFPLNAEYRLAIYRTTSVGIEEFDEAVAIVAQWREDDKPLVMGART